MSERRDKIKLYDWILQEFTVAARMSLVEELKPHLSPLIQPRASVLDLCCGAGPFSFSFEEMGAQVTALDIAPSMISMAKAEAGRRKSGARFVEADVLNYDLGVGVFDLAVLLGNTIADFSIGDTFALSKKVHSALKPGGEFALNYRDWLYRFIRQTGATEFIQQEGPERITVRMKQYQPEQAAYTETYMKHSTGETCDYTSYIYTPVLVRLALRENFKLTNRVRLGEESFFDIYKRL